MWKNGGKVVFALTTGAILMVVAVAAVADTTGTIGANTPALGMKNVQLTGFGAYEFGQMVKGEDQEEIVDHFWSQEADAGIGIIGDLSDRMKLVAGIQGKMWYVWGPGGEQGYDRGSCEQHFSVWLTEASGTYSFGGTKENPYVQLTAGYFPYKYDPEARNLGEYLFRSFTPGLIFNSFDFPAADLFGFKGSINLCDGAWKNDFLVLDNAAIWPFGDISLAYVTSYNIGKVIEFGAGVDFYSQISVNSNNTTPPISANNMMLDRSGNAIRSNERITTANGASDTSWDTSYYSFSQIKPMARMAIDPKPLLEPLLNDIGKIFGDEELGKELGAEDFKLYSEIALLGVKNLSYYFGSPGVYGTVYPWMRLPIMFGVNVPTWRLLDVCNIEFEHYATPFDPTDRPETDPGEGEPIPDPQAWSQAYNNGAHELNALAWKWSIYMKKTLTPGVACILQLARDHTRLNYEDGYPTYSENLLLPGQWEWTAKIEGKL